MDKLSGLMFIPLGALAAVALAAITTAVVYPIWACPETCWPGQMMPRPERAGSTATVP